MICDFWLFTTLVLIILIMISFPDPLTYPSPEKEISLVLYLWRHWNADLPVYKTQYTTDAFDVIYTLYPTAVFVTHSFIIYIFQNLS